MSLTTRKPPLTHSDLIFPSQSLSLSTTLTSLKRSALSIPNRLTSIISDSLFVQSVSRIYALPLVANERCGSWYIPPSLKAAGVYFKSTDGHANEWSFSTRRLNYQLFDVVEESGGCVVVDSTRRGKSMPDALAKTVPVWCCVMNRAIYPERRGTEAGRLFTSPRAVGGSEHAQIEERVDGFVERFLEICKPDLGALRGKLKGRWLRPIWVVQGGDLPDERPVFEDCVPVVLCTASRRVRGGEGSEGGYVQGAADDHEAWSCGLTPTAFWENKELLLGTNEEDLPEVIRGLVGGLGGSKAVPVLVKPTTNLFVSSSENLDIDPFDVIISCTPEALSTTNPEHVKTKQYLHLACQTLKLGSRDLRNQLQSLEAFMASVPDLNSRKIVICCPTGKDLSIGVALAIVCLYVNDEGVFTPEKRTKVDKTFIKQRLTWITTAAPGMNPSRETLKSVNSFLMPDPYSNSQSPSSASPPKTKSLLTLLPTNTTTTTCPMATTTSTPPTTTTKTTNKTPSPGLDPQIHIPVTDIPIFDIPSPILRAHRRSIAPHQPSPPLPPQPQPQPPSQPLAPLIHRTLHNKGAPWTFTRTLTSTLPSHPSGTVSGTATFTPQPPNNPASKTLIYSEECTFVTNQGVSFTANMKYVYVLSPPPTSPSTEEGDEEGGGGKDEGGCETVNVHFHTPSATSEDVVGDLFVSMGEVTADAREGGEGEDGVLVAENRATHLCGRDLYAARWKFGRGFL
ncbi:hypothetical protein BU24DRAFT_425308, partial [Aaosphaeria arxii CBS 175.79]